MLHLTESIRAYVSDENISELKRYDFEGVSELKIYIIKISEFIFIRDGK